MSVDQPERGDDEETGSRTAQPEPRATSGRPCRPVPLTSG